MAYYCQDAASCEETQTVGQRWGQEWGQRQAQKKGSSESKDYATLWVPLKEKKKRSVRRVRDPEEQKMTSIQKKKKNTHSAVQRGRTAEGAQE